MAKRFKTTGNYFVVTDTKTDVEEIRESKGNISYKEFDSSIYFYLISTGKIISVETYNKDTVVNGDSNDAVFVDTQSLKTYLNNNTGFNTASGSSGALAIPDKFIFDTSVTRDAYFKNNPSKKTIGLDILVKTPVLTLERWDGTKWDSTTAVIQGPTGGNGSRGPSGSTGSKIIAVTSSDNRDGTFNIVFVLDDRSRKTIKTPNLKGNDGTSIISITPSALKTDDSVDLTFAFSDSTTKVVNIPLPSISANIPTGKYLEEVITSLSYRVRLTSSWTNLCEFLINSNKNKVSKVDINYNVLRQYQGNLLGYQIINKLNGDVYFSASLPTRYSGFQLKQMLKNIEMPKSNELHLLIRARLASSRAVVESKSVILTITPAT